MGRPKGSKNKSKSKKLTGYDVRPCVPSLEVLNARVTALEKLSESVSVAAVTELKLWLENKLDTITNYLAILQKNTGTHDAPVNINEIIGMLNEKASESSGQENHQES